MNLLLKCIKGTWLGILFNFIIIVDIAAGGSDDWFKGENDAKYAYTVELPGSGPNGFDPPLDMIFPLVAETWEGIKAGGNYIGTKYGKPKI